MHVHTIVAGLGAMGAATAYQLARAGVSVLGIDRFTPPHAQGSTHGDTRVTRQAIGEGPQYSPLALRAHEIWRDIEAATGRDLLHADGALIISSPSRSGASNVADFFGNTLRAARQYDIAHEILDAAEIRRRFPQFAVGDDQVGYWEPGAGYLRPEACVEAQLQLAQAHGATLHTGETILGFEPHGEGVRVRTDRGEYTAEKLVLTLGPWLTDLLDPALSAHYTVMRQILYWFAPKGPISPFEPGRFPVFIWEPPGASRAIYGFPAIDGAHGGIKVASGQYADSTTAQSIERRVDPAEIRWMYEHLVAPCFPGISDQCLRTATCMYTVTPDFGFVFDTHPQTDAVMIASPCSGHGFKHSAAIGEALAQWAIDGRSRIDLGGFSARRFAVAAAADR